MFGNILCTEYKFILSKTYLSKLNKQGYSQTFIAKSMNRSKSTISRELSRNTGKKGYRYKQADRLANE
jgi:IS30 family transposase